MADSNTKISLPLNDFDVAMALATAKPTTPAPITTQSTVLSASIKNSILKSHFETQQHSCTHAGEFGHQENICANMLGFNRNCRNKCGGNGLFKVVADDRHLNTCFQCNIFAFVLKWLPKCRNIETIAVIAVDVCACRHAPFVIAGIAELVIQPIRAPLNGQSWIVFSETAIAASVARHTT